LPVATVSGLVTVVQPPGKPAQEPVEKLDVLRSRTPVEASTPAPASLPLAVATTTLPSAS
jgi:hypothetical protein